MMLYGSRLVNKVCNNRIFNYLGDISFDIFLLNQPVFAFLMLIIKLSNGIWFYNSGYLLVISMFLLLGVSCITKLYRDKIGGLLNNVIYKN